MLRSPTPTSRRTIRFRLLILVVLLVLLVPVRVLAQDPMFAPEQLRPTENDVSVRLLHGILGSVIDQVRLADSLGTGDEGAFGGLFRTFNGFLLLVLGLLVFVKAVVALLDTAHEGQALGQDRSTVWTPLRLVIGVGLLLPLVNGFALAQIIVLWLTLSGVGLANAVWDQAVDQFSRTALYAEPPPAQKIFEGQGDLGECVTAATGSRSGGRCLSAIDAAAEHYATRLKSLVAGVVNLVGQRAFSEFTVRAQEEGWMSAGSWFYRLMALTDFMNKLALNVPEPYPIRVWEKLPKEDIETYAIAIKRLEAVVLEAESDGGLGLTTGDPNNSAIDDVSRGFLRATLEWIAQALFGKVHPIFAIAWMGHALIATVIGALGVFGAAKLIATTSGAGRIAQALGGMTDLLTAQNPSNAFTVTSLVIGMVVLALLGFALTAAMFLPLAPFMIWTVACLHWLIRVFEALVAAPVWAVMFLKNGRGLMAETATGWLLLFSLLLTPALMVIGLLAATVVSYGFLTLVSGTFVVAAINANSGNTTGPVILVGLLIVFVLLAVDLTLRSFSLIHRLPDAALRWVGSQVEGALDHHEVQRGIQQGLLEARQTGLNVASNLAGRPPNGGKGMAKVKPMDGGEKTPGD